jgi:hypothetical protein
LLVTAETAEPSSDALETEIERWSSFARALRKDDREAFGELMNVGRSHAVEIGNANRTTVFEPLIMSIMVALDEELRRIQEELNALRPAPPISTEEKKPSIETPKPVAVCFKKKKPGGEQTRLS